MYQFRLLRFLLLIMHCLFKTSFFFELLFLILFLEAFQFLMTCKVEFVYRLETALPLCEASDFYSRVSNVP
jgi:hypothetical protein